LLLLVAFAPPATLPTGAQPGAVFRPSDEKPDDFPDHPGRDDTFYACTACHGFKLVAAQGQSRRQWEAVLDFMVERHNMPPLSAKDRTAVLDYLETAFPPRSRAGSPNPFLNR
jgi:hypothetical protein